MNQKKHSLYFALGLVIFSIATISITVISGYQYVKTKKELVQDIENSS